jgi:hypothetical protein
MPVPLNLARTVLANPRALPDARRLAEALVVEYERVRYALTLLGEERARAGLQAAKASNEPPDIIAFWQGRLDDARTAVEDCRDTLDEMGARYFDGHDR